MSFSVRKSLGLKSSTNSEGVGSSPVVKTRHHSDLGGGDDAVSNKIESIDSARDENRGVSDRLGSVHGGQVKVGLVKSRLKSRGENNFSKSADREEPKLRRQGATVDPVSDVNYPSEGPPWAKFFSKYQAFRSKLFSYQQLRYKQLRYKQLRYQQWLALLISASLLLFSISVLEPEQREVLFSWTFGWFVGGESGSVDDLLEGGHSSFNSVDSSTVLGIPALVCLGLSMLCAGLGWLQEFWSDVKSRLFSRSASITVAIIFSIIALTVVQTKAEEVLVVALGLGWLIMGIFQRLVSYARVVVGRSVARLSPHMTEATLSKVSNSDGSKAPEVGPREEIQLFTLDVGELKVGDTIKLSEGEQVPCDGIVVGGAAIVNEVRFSPLGRVVNRCENDRLYAGSRILRGGIELRIEERFGDNDLSINLANLDRSLNEPIAQDLEDYKLQRILILSGMLFALGVSGLHWVWFSSPAASFVLAAAMLLSLVFVSAPTFFFPLRRLCILRAFHRGAFVAKASSLTALSKVEHVVVDMAKGAEVANCELRSFRIFDDTLDGKGILDLILSLLARVDLRTNGHAESFWYCLHDALCKDPKFGTGGNLGRPVKLDSFSLSSRGLHGEVEGLPVYLGDVQFLLENNVVIDVADVPYVSHPEKLLLLAMGREAIASMVVVPTSLSIEASDLKKLREWGYKVSLVSDADRKEVDLQGKVSGFDLGSIHGGLTGVALDEKLSSIPAAAIFSLRGLKRDIGFLVVPFDEVRREFEDGEVTLFSRSVRPLVDLLVFSNQSAKLRRYLLWGTLLASGLAVILTIAFPQLMWIGILIGGMCNLSAYLFLQFLTPKL